MTEDEGLFLLMVSIVLLSFLDRYGHGIVNHMTEDEGMLLFMVSILRYGCRCGVSVLTKLINR